VATIPSVEGESVSLRLLGQESFSLAELGLNARLGKMVEELLAMPNGILLITGPTGSGKSTSLYCFLSPRSTPRTGVLSRSRIRWRTSFPA